MAWTYDPALLDESTSDGRKNIVRLLIGDTNTDDQQMQDEEILFALTLMNDDYYNAAIWCCNTLAAKFSRKVNSEVEGMLKKEYTDIAKAYYRLAGSLNKTRNKTGGRLGSNFSGTNAATLAAVKADESRVQPDFTKGRFDNEGNG